MLSFISDSNRRFIIGTIAVFILLAGLFLFFAESTARQLEKNTASQNLRMMQSNLPYKDFAIIGTSHSRQKMPKGIRILNAHGPMTIPTVMYFKAKKMVELQPDINVVYLEADNHLFFNGPNYSLENLSPAEKTSHPIFQNWGDFLRDPETEMAFGELQYPNDDIWLALEDNVRPIIVKRMAMNLLKKFSTEADEKKISRTNNICSNPERYALTEAELEAKSTWASYSNDKQKIFVQKKLELFNLDKPHEMFEQQKIYFEKTIELLQQHGVEVVLVRYPVSQLYQDMTHKTNKAQVEKYLETLIKKYKIDIIKLTSLNSKNDNFFKNADHIALNQHLFVGKLILRDYCLNRN